MQCSSYPLCRFFSGSQLNMKRIHYFKTWRLLKAFTYSIQISIGTISHFWFSHRVISILKDDVTEAWKLGRIFSPLCWINTNFMIFITNFNITRYLWVQSSSYWLAVFPTVLSTTMPNFKTNRPVVSEKNGNIQTDRQTHRQTNDKHWELYI